MDGINQEIEENTFMHGKTLQEALFSFGDQVLIGKLNIARPAFGKKPPKGFWDAVGQTVTDLNNLQITLHTQKKIYAELQKDILEKIRMGDLIPFGFKEPRNIQDIPIKIPGDLFFSGELNWEKSELKYRNIEFTGIRLLADLNPIINAPARISPKMKMLENSENNKSEKSNSQKSKKLDFSNLEADRYLNEKDAAQFLGISYKTLQGYRVKGGGPEYRKFSTKMVRYMMADLIKWAESKKKKNTSE